MPLPSMVIPVSLTNSRRTMCCRVFVPRWGYAARGETEGIAAACTDQKNEGKSHGDFEVAPAGAQCAALQAPHATEPSFIELAVRAYLQLLQRRKRDQLDLRTINRLSEKLNKEAEDVLGYQRELRS